MGTTPTRLQGLAPPVARVVLIAVGVICVALVLLSLQVGPPPLPRPGAHGDLELYGNVVTRLRAGESYHQALHAELLAGDYGTLSVFNWRPPFFLTVVSWFPSNALAQIVLVLVSAVAGITAGVVVGRDGPRAMVLGMALLAILSLVSVLVPQAALTCELWAGVLTLLSVSSYGLGLRRLGFAAAVLALLCREISGIYVLICVALAVRERRWREVAMWAVVLTGFAIYYGWHAEMVWSLLGPADRAYKEGWLQVGGAMFLLSASSFNGMFMLAPMWVTALILPLALLGVLASPAAWMTRVGLTVAAYLLIFAFVGKPVNLYWGALYTPLLSFGLLWAGPAVRDLWVAALVPRATA